MSCFVLVGNSVIRYSIGALHFLLFYDCVVFIKLPHTSLKNSSTMLFVFPKTIKDGTPITCLKLSLLKEASMKVN